MAFWLCTLLLIFNFSGYIALLYALAKWIPRPNGFWRGQAQPQLSDPPLYVLVPVWNERPYLREKLENLLGLIYEKSKLKILICDANSTDGSLETIRDLLGENVAVVQSGERGKMHQLNAGIKLVPENAFVAISDADALFVRPESLLRAVDYFEDPKVGMVGAWGLPNPATALMAERAYWDKQNRLRYLETKACTSSIVTAQFYLFRKKMLASFPVDCVADDVYAALFSHTRNLQVVYAHEIEAVERRQPQSITELFFHKFRKANAYTRELLRPLYQLPYLSKRRKLIYSFKIYQFFYLPWIAAFFLASSCYRAAHGQWASLLLAYGALFLTTLGASFLVETPPGKNRGGFSPAAALPTVIVFTMVNAILMANSVLFPFWQQNARYERVGGK